jgi:hypothetical protein
MRALAVALPALTLAAPAWAAESSSWNTWSVGIPVQVPLSPLQVESVASKWIVEFDYARGRPSEIVPQDCVVLVNRSTEVPITYARVVFAAVDTAGVPKRPSLTLAVRGPIKPGQSSPLEYTCLSRGYVNGDRGFWLAGWVDQVDFADGTSWHAPPQKDVVPYVASAVRERSSHN